jgi:hypothetical protein
MKKYHIFLLLILIIFPLLVKANDLTQKLSGRILLQVEEKGEAWYVSPHDQKRYFLGRPDDAFSVMREQGVGITNINLLKIPVSLNNLTGPDNDKDGLPDLFEDAIGTDKNSPDTDSDGYTDYIEILNGYNPLGSGKFNFDINFAKAQSGKIFLQVESKGEAWYVNPVDNKRYFLGRSADAYQVMRKLGLGISNKDLGKLVEAKVLGEVVSNNSNQVVSSEAELISFAKNISKQCLPMDIIMIGNEDIEGAQSLLKFSAIGITENKCVVRELALNGSYKNKTADCSLDLPSEAELDQMKESDYSLYADMLPNVVGFDALGEIQNGRKRQCSGDLSDAALIDVANY